MTRRPRLAKPKGKRRAEARGRRAELAAAWLLRLKGYAILARRWRCPVGEVDLVARRGRTLAFVEVKTLTGPRARAEPVSARQQIRIVRAASAFRARRPALATLDIRYDLIVSAPGGWPRHIRDAWRPEAGALAALI